MADINVKATVQYETIEPYKIELTRGQKGAYGWTITVHGARIGTILNELTSLDTSLRTSYLEATPQPPTE